MSRRACKTDPSFFCYVCGEYIIGKKGCTVTEALKLSYLYYFGIAVENLDKPWTPKMFCNACRTKLYRWSMGEKIYLPFKDPVIWRGPSDHVTDCYFCLTDTTGITKKILKDVKYANVLSVTKSVPRGPNDPLPIYPVASSQESERLTPADSSGSEFTISQTQPDDKHLITQAELNDLARDLHLSKQDSELLASRLQQWKCLSSETKITYFRNRNAELITYFNKIDQICFCTDVQGLFEKMNQPYDPNEWRLFIDSSKYSLKAALLHNGNQKPSIPIAHAVNMKETYKSMEKILEVIKYNNHKWKICGDLKAIGLLMGMQSGFTKYCCFLCLWDSRATTHHYIRTSWPERQQYSPGKQNVSNKPLVDPQDVFLPPLHIKLGLMKNFVKAIDREGPAFQYLTTKFPKISFAKIKEGIFVGPQIRELINDEQFPKRLSAAENAAWASFKKVVREFLGNRRSDNYKQIVADLLENYCKIGARMSLKLHFLHSHLDFFPQNLGAVSDEQGERMHQDMQKIERNYQGFWDEGMLSDYCWSLIRETDSQQQKRQSLAAVHF